MNATEQTLKYYDDNAESFVSTTANVEFGHLQERFAAMLPAGGRILDLGCGSGRDSLAFKNAGFQVDAMDGSKAMVEAASKLTGLPVVHALFDEFEPEGSYDGIWACSSLLHVPLEQLKGLLEKYAAALKPNGVFYLSFKLGNFEGERNGRWFTDLDESAFRQLIDGVPGLHVEAIDITGDVRPGREQEKWLNAWCVRVAPEVAPKGDTL